MTAELTLRFEGKKYVVRESVSSAESAEFYFTDGNGACDCNLSMMIRQQVDPTVPDLPCGTTRIKLVSLAVDGQPVRL
jgi:hypothetical protein